MGNRDREKLILADVRVKKSKQETPLHFKCDAKKRTAIIIYIAKKTI